MVLTELVGNAVEHGFPGDGGRHRCEVDGSRARGVLTGQHHSTTAPGLPEKFSLDGSDRLGLQIVRTLVGAELDATMDLVRPWPGGSPAPTVQLRHSAEPYASRNRS